MRRALVLGLLLLACKSEKPAPPAPAKTVRVDVWHDTVCPWCRIGIHNLETAAKQVAPGVAVEIVCHPFLLDPDAPPQGKSLREHLGARYGEAKLDEMFARVSQFGGQYGVQFRWDLVTMMPNTVASHALIDWAPAQKKQAVIEALHRAYFEEGKDIGSTEVLLAIARENSLDAQGAFTADRLATVRTSASTAGISGVPYFVIAGQGFNGAQPPERLKAAIEKASPSP